MSRTREEFEKDRVEKWYAQERYREAQERFLDAQLIAIDEGILPEDTKLCRPYRYEDAPPYVKIYEEGM